MITAWALPADSGGLDFTETEIAFLFPAPLRRRDILLYKIVRAQPQALFSALIMTVLGWWRNGLFVGVWAAISVLGVYFTLVSLGRARLRLMHIGFLARLAGVAAIMAGLYWIAKSEVSAINFQRAEERSAGHERAERAVSQAADPRDSLHPAPDRFRGDSALGRRCSRSPSRSSSRSASASSSSPRDSTSRSKKHRSPPRRSERRARTARAASASGTFVMFRRAPAPFKLQRDRAGRRRPWSGKT